MATCLLEVCVDSLYSAEIAEQNGCDRLELCCALELGGLTPSHALIDKVCRSITKCKIHVLIRPRSSDFCYTEDELDVIRQDILYAATAGAHGIVCGFITPDGTIDVSTTRSITSLCNSLGLDFTFHRAFDIVNNQLQALSDLSECGVNRVLTSGGYRNAVEGAKEIANLVSIGAKEGVTIMAGGGISPDNVQSVLQATNVREIHGTFGINKDSCMNYIHPRVRFTPSCLSHVLSDSDGDKGEEEEEDDDDDDEDDSEVIKGNFDRSSRGHQKLRHFWRTRVTDGAAVAAVKYQIVLYLNRM